MRRVGHHRVDSRRSALRGIEALRTIYPPSMNPTHNHLSTSTSIPLPLFTLQNSCVQPKALESAFRSGRRLWRVRLSTNRRPATHATRLPEPALPSVGCQKEPPSNASLKLHPFHSETRQEPHPLFPPCRRTCSASPMLFQLQ